MHGVVGFATRSLLIYAALSMYGEAGLTLSCIIFTSCILTSKDKHDNTSKVIKHKGKTCRLQQQACGFCLHA